MDTLATKHSIHFLKTNVKAYFNKILILKGRITKKAEKEVRRVATFGSRLKELRQKNHMKQAELGEIVHVTLGTVSIWERDIRKPDFATIETLCDIFDVSLAYMLGMNDDPTSPGVMDTEVANQLAEEDDMEHLSHIARTMTRLSESSLKIVSAAIAAAYRADKERGILQRGYRVKVESFSEEEPEPDI